MINISAWIRNVDVNSREWTITAELVDNALSSDGLFLAVGHDIAESTFNSAISAAYNLFSANRESLNDVEMKGGNSSMRGYIGYGKESGLQQFFEPKEGYSFGYDWKSPSTFTNKLQGYNVWPDGLDTAVKSTLLGMFSHSAFIAEAIVTNLAVYYEKVTRSSMSIVVNGGDTISIMRLFHYFSEQAAIERPTGRTPIGSSPHTDWGLLTVITQELNTTGLQVRHADADGSFFWQDVSPLKGSVVINGGDLLSLLSKGRYASPVHRVLCPVDEKDRMSYVFFYYPNYDTQLDLGDVCAAGEAVSGEGEGGRHNTLTRIRNKANHASAKDGGNIRFGDYILLKWEEVFRGE